MVELADTPDLGSGAVMAMRVRVSLGVHNRSNVERRRRLWHTVRSARLTALYRMTAQLATLGVI
jgi:hypothetical protein